MKFNFDIKTKKTELEADVEQIVEKGMEIHERTWKDKFNTKFNAKKELLKIKHNHKMELEENNKTKKNWIQKIIEENRKTKELELEYKRKREEDQLKIMKIKIILSIILGIIGLPMTVVGFILGSSSGNPDSGWYVMAIIGIVFLGSSAFDLSDNLNKQK